MARRHTPICEGSTASLAVATMGGSKRSLGGPRNSMQ
jgi:hypothetical protein